MKSALVILADGAEEMEAVITIDVLRRAKVEVTVAGLSGSDPVKCSRGVMIKPDTSLSIAKHTLYDAVVLPGGLDGAQNLSQSTVAKDILEKQYKIGNLIAAICAAPTVLADFSIAKGKRATCYPSLSYKLKDYSYTDKKVVIDGNLLTSQGPGTAYDFALEIVKTLQGVAMRDEVAKAMLL